MWSGRVASIITLVILQRVFVSHAFVVPSELYASASSYRTSPKITTAVGTTATSTTKLTMGMEDFLYGIQSSASGLADWSLGGGADGGAVVGVAALPVLYLAGLLTSLSPCSLGLLPVTLSYISVAACERRDRAALLPTLAFAAGLATVFCGLGLSVALLGGVFGGQSGGGNAGTSFMSLVPVLVSSAVSVTMGLQLLDLVNVPLPSFEIDLPFLREDTTSSSVLEFGEDGAVVMSTPESVTSDTTYEINQFYALFRTYLLGGSSALLASPCATPVLTSILAFVGASRDPVVGASLLFTYTAGYSTILLLVAGIGGDVLARASDPDSDSILSRVGNLVSPFSGAVLIAYGTDAFLNGVFGDPSLSGLSPIL